LIHILNDARLRIAVTEVLNEITSPRQLDNLDCLKFISDILRFLLTLFVHEKKIDFDMMSAILESSQFLYHTQNNRKTFLTQFLHDHGIWSNSMAWKECIELTMKKRMQESSERIKKRQEQKKKDKPADAKPKNLFGLGFGKIKTLMQSKESKFNEEVFKHTNLIFNELSKYV